MKAKLLEEEWDTGRDELASQETELEEAKQCCQEYAAVVEKAKKSYHDLRCEKDKLGKQHESNWRAHN